MGRGPALSVLSATLPAVLSAVLALLSLTACTRPSAKPQAFAVSESFETRPGAFVRALAVDGPALWVATSDGVLKIDRKSGRMQGSYTTESGLMVNYVFTVSPAPDGNIWFGTNGGGLARVEGERVKTYHVPDGLADPWVYNIAYQRDGTLWAGTWNGVSRWDGEKLTSYGVKDGLINRWVYAVAVDLDDSVWFGTEGGLSRFDGKTWKSWTHADGLGAPNKARLPASPNTGYGALKSGERHHHDLSALDAEGRETYNENYVFSLLIDPEGVKWIGNWGGGLSRFDGKTWKNFTAEDGLAGNVVYAIAREPSGRLWFGTHRGLCTYDGKTWFTVPPSGRYQAKDVYAVTADPDGSVWMGYKGGVARVRPVGP